MRFIKRWFESTLAAYKPPPHDRLVVNVGADLNSWATLALGRVEPLLWPGSLLYFDELNDRAHELRAPDELIERTGIRRGVVAAAPELSHVAFRRAA